MKKLLLVAIILIAGFLRFYQIGVNPPSMSWDEVAFGYNAYSIGIDGKDEFGQFLPYKYLESFGDFKPPMYAYLDVVPIKIFGLTVFATRFPSALFGTLTVLITYFLVCRVFYSSKHKEYYGLASALVLAVSPWHIMLSRAAFEANVATFFLVAGVWLFLGGVQEKKWYLPLSAASFVASTYTFNTSRVVAPLLVIFLTIIFAKKLLRIKVQALAAFFVGLVLIAPIGLYLFSPQAKLRFQEVNIFSDVSVIRDINQQVTTDNNVWWSKIIHNRRLVFAGDYIQHYFDNLNPNFLFVHGDGNPKFSTQDVGQMYIWDLLFFVVGILLLFRNKEGNWWLVPLWLILGIIPAATARETPHALRTEAALPTFQIFVGYGFVQLMLYIKKYRIAVISGLLLVLLFNFSYFWHGLMTHYPIEHSGDWLYGYPQSIRYVESVEKNFNHVYVADDYGRPYIYYLFYTKENPQNYRKTAQIHRDAFGFVNILGYNKYSFGESFPVQSNALYINVPARVPASAKILKKFYALNGDTIFVAYTL